MAGLLVTIAIADHPSLYAGHRSQVIVLDQAYTDEAALHLRLEAMLGASVHRVTIRKTDLVEDTTVVDVRYRVRQLDTRFGSELDSLAGPASR
jgi:hypothetical protein